MIWLISYEVCVHGVVVDHGAHHHVHVPDRVRQRNYAVTLKSIWLRNYAVT